MRSILLEFRKTRRIVADLVIFEVDSDEDQERRTIIEEEVCYVVCGRFRPTLMVIACETIQRGLWSYGAESYTVCLLKKIAESGDGGHHQSVLAVVTGQAVISQAVAEEKGMFAVCS